MVKRTLFVLDMTLDFLKNLPPVEESGNPGLANNGYYGCKEAAERPHSSVYGNKGSPWLREFTK